MLFFSNVCMFIYNLHDVIYFDVYVWQFLLLFWLKVVICLYMSEK